MNGTKGKPKKAPQQGSRWRSFWDGLERAQKLVVFLTALCGLIGAAYGIYYKFFSAPPPSALPLPTPTPPSPTARLEKLKKCANLKVIVFKHMPYYLIPTLDNSPREYLYWAKLIGQNNCKDEPLDVRVKFFIKSSLAYLAGDEETNRDEERGGPGAGRRGFARMAGSGGDSSTLWTGTVEPMAKKSDFLVPKIKFTKEDPDEILKVEWEIQTHKDNLRIKGGTEYINVISKNYIYWDLKDGDGVQVDPKFLLASLLAWTRVKTPELKSQAKRYSSGAAGRQYRLWFKACYDDLLGPGGSLNVHAYTSPWPLAGPADESRQRVRSPVEFITGKAIDPNSLEAVLLVAALVYNHSPKPDLALFALPFQTDIAAKRFFVAWSHNGRDWRALDLTSPQDLSFEDNESQATGELSQLLRAKPDVLRELNRVGVFIEGEKFSDGGQKVLALNFAKAAEKLKIQGLP